MSESCELLVLGAGGMLGREVFALARERFGEHAVGTDRARLDLRDGAALKALLERLRPRSVINCAGIVPKAQADELTMLAVNGEMPHRVAEGLSGWGGRLVQISTDCVFSGKAGNYTELDRPDAAGAYALSKIQGELLHAPHLTVRTSFVGFERGTQRGLLAWFMAQKGTVLGYRRAIWSGVTNVFLAGLLLELAERGEITGLLNVAGESVSKYELLKMAAEVFKKNDVRIEPADEPALDLSLNNLKLSSLGYRVPPIRRLLEGLLPSRSAARG